MIIEYKRCRDIEMKKIIQLFCNGGWSEGADELMLYNALQNTSHLVTAWDKNRVIGLIRSMDDDSYSATIDVLIVDKQYQGKGIATALIKELLKDLIHIKYISVSPNESKNAALYERVGFKKIKEGVLLQIVNKESG